jgi:hypothetical protein
MSGDPFLGQLGEPVIPGACPLLRREPEGIYTCTDRKGIHGYYLKGPNIWPTHPDQIKDYPSCSYKFELVKDGN